MSRRAWLAFGAVIAVGLVVVLAWWLLRSDVPTTEEELRDRALEAIEANDPEAVVALMADWDRLLEICPGFAALGELGARKRGRERLLEKVRDRLKGCHELLDLAGAERVSERRGRSKAVDENCPDLKPRADFHVIYRAGDREVEVWLDDPFEHEGRFYLGDYPRCRLYEP